LFTFAQYVSAKRPFTTNEALAKANKFFSYHVFMANSPEKAAKEMDADHRSAIRAVAHIADSKLPAEFLTRTDTFIGPWRDYIKANNLSEIPFSGIMTKKVEDYMVESYKKQGFYNSKVCCMHILTVVINWRRSIKWLPVRKQKVDT
jgi:hypothetical protein